MIDPRTPYALLRAELPALDAIGTRAAAILRESGVTLLVDARVEGAVMVTVRDEDRDWTVGARHVADAVTTVAARLGRSDVVRWVTDMREALRRADTMPAPAGGNDSSNEVTT